MDFFTRTILSYILLYKYWALGIMTFFAALALPIPAGTILVASSAFASQGYLNIFILVVVVIIANIAGDSCCYWLARLFGKQVLSKIPFFRRILNSKDYKLIEETIVDRPGAIVFVSRFEVMATLTVNIMAGIGKVPYRKYLLFESMGAVVDCVFYALIGFLFADSWEAINDIIGRFSIVIFIILAVSLVFFWKRLMKRLSIEHVAKKNK